MDSTYISKDMPKSVFHAEKWYKNMSKWDSPFFLLFLLFSGQFSFFTIFKHSRKVKRMENEFKLQWINFKHQIFF